MGALAPEKILKQLAGLWVNLEKQSEGGPGAGALRACTLTLVVVTRHDDNPAGLSETLASLMPRHPARMITIRLAPEAEPTADVTAHCWMPSGQRQQVCSEEIQISAAADAADELAAVVAPLVAADLPVVLWCRDASLIQRPAFARYAGMATRVLIDSADLGDSKDAIQTLSALAAKGLRIGDLSWTRLTRWREMLSQVFENRKYAACLPQIENVEITSGGAPTPVRAYYMAAWIGDALRAAGGRPDVRFDSDPAGTEAQLLGVELSCGEFRLKLERQEDRLFVTVDGLRQCTNLPMPTDYLLMNEELGIMGRDPIFERVLPAAAQL